MPGQSDQYSVSKDGEKSTEIGGKNIFLKTWIKMAFESHCTVSRSQELGSW